MSALELSVRAWTSLGEQERSAYRAVVSACPHASVFHAVEWLDVLERCFSPEASCILARSGERLVGAFPFFALPGPFPGHTNHSCLRDRDMVYGGPVAGLLLPDGLDERGLLEALLDRFEAGPGTLASLVLPSPRFPAELLASRGYRMTPHLTAAIDLDRSHDDLWAGVHPKTRNMIAKARRSGLTVSEASADDLTALPEMIAAPYHRARKEPPPGRYLLEVAGVLGGAGLARVLVACGRDGRPVAGAIFLRHRDQSYYWAGGALREGYDAAASHLVQWEGIEAARADGCVQHDLLMVDPVKAPGIARFKLRFGARVVPLYTASRSRLMGRVLGRVWSLAGLLPAALAAREPSAASGALCAAGVPDGRRA